MYERSPPPIIFLAFGDSPYRSPERLSDELRQLSTLLESSVRAGRCDLVERPWVTLDEILAVFQDERFRNRIAVFHLAGYTELYSLLVETDWDTPLPLGAAGLAEFLAAQTGLKLVFLNACSTLDQTAGLRAANVPAVIATSEELDRDLALPFAWHFYRGLAGGRSIGDAFGMAQGALVAKTYGEKELDRGLWVLLADEEAMEWRLVDQQEEGDSSSHLTGSQIDRLSKAIISAHTRDELRRVVLVCMNEDFDSLVPDRAYRLQVFELVQWAIRQDRIEELAKCAHEENRGNKQMAALYTELFVARRK